ncbi:GNAT family N-acetyltransferase [Streptomyces olivaceus]|uniref:GNAT family N-acetyltransferase n=1 Tax=Streptomyces olivaceus TaxID=47716 RepID=A0ABS7W6K2_STROV|nr:MULTISPECIES: GNAT family N-acetyltransferase [Streptomyces]MBZ6083592.1 GNAT family N-acetyltransferase [Streptomyces olivaceus]MBZ6091090.1 GNAT family N-acetyltransferase [Streptomyces olivaceus]MBZ6097265.1 GNAT family N-acetyltransferase [Streptomyces olivaceus]MBZ6121356.1 GNAT family N-acetyltransferase [Streptomyces olivaceus]MBZ6153590.1 GNAT family N-acetyltransferase [Streptomyces olivaceus]
MSVSVPGDYVIRSIRADEWPAVKELRLRALRDPVADLAYLETYDDAAARPDSFWQERAARGAEGAPEGSGVRQIVAEGPGGLWIGTLTVLVEEAGTTDWAGFAVERRQGHVVGVFVRPEWRGSGLTKALFDAGVEWARANGAERVRLIVHPENGRARAAYRKSGFVPSGRTVPLAGGPGDHELEYVLER